MLKLSSRKRIIFILCCFSIASIILFFRLLYLQLIKGNYLHTAAESQQSTSRIVGNKRGNLYDCSGENILAISSTVYTITVNPIKINSSIKPELAKTLSQIFELDYEKTLKKLNKTTGTETIVKRKNRLFKNLDARK